jgi:hypothetical protein
MESSGIMEWNNGQRKGIVRFFSEPPGSCFRLTAS